MEGGLGGGCDLGGDFREMRRDFVKCEGSGVVLCVWVMCCGCVCMAYRTHVQSHVCTHIRTHTHT